MKRDYGKENGINLKLIIALSRFAQKLSKKISPDFHDAGLTETQFAVLEALYHKGSMTVNEIIAKTLSTSGNIGVVVENLLKEDLVAKTVAPQDRRSRIITITPSGKKIMDDLFPKHLKTMAIAMEELTNEEKQTIIDILKNMTQAKGE